MLKNRRKILKLSALALAAPLFSKRAEAEKFPNKPITLIVPSPPGGNLDITARTLSIPLAKALGQSVIVENRGGGGGAVGAGALARAKPDGYTLLLSVPSFIATVPQMIKTHYSRSDFYSIGLVNRTSVILVTRSDDSRFNSFEEFAALVRSQPGTVSAGHPGAGTPNHQAMLLLEDAMDARFNIVSYRGSGPALLDLTGGHIDAYFDQVTSSISYIKAGKLRPLAVLGPERDRALPDVPTISELGLTPIDGTTYVGIYAPANTPENQIELLASALETATSDEKYINTLKELGSNAFFGEGAQLNEMLIKEEEVAIRLVKAGRLRSE